MSLRLLILACREGTSPNPLADIWSALACPVSVPDPRDMKRGVRARTRPSSRIERLDSAPARHRVQLFRRSVRL